VNETGRFAPSTTGPAHPGTLLAALLCWLDARSLGARLLLRLEDLDPQRCRPEWSDAMRRDLDWLGLDFDAVEAQHAARARHEAALDRLAERGLVYACRCTRTELRGAARTIAEGGVRYPGTCRGRGLPRGGWRATDLPLRVALPAGRIELRDESGADLGHDPVEEIGDPIVRRRDGAFAYQLAGVVDDAAGGVTRVVRGRDLAASTATQVALQRLLGLPQPRYRHHLLLLEERGAKLAKLHGAVAADALRARYDAPGLCGVLAHAAGLARTPGPTTPAALLAGFSWDRVARDDRALRWDGERLALAEGPPSGRSPASPWKPWIISGHTSSVTATPSRAATAARRVASSRVTST
jgi:glutamyl/glutaminyl-tRNA synthetase